MKRLIYGALASISALLMAAIPLAASAQDSNTSNTVVVSQENMKGWMFIDDQNNSQATATGTMIEGPGSPPLGSGSAELQTMVSSDGQALMKNAYAGEKFSNLTTLSYSTYVVTGSEGSRAPALQFSVDKDVADNDTSWQGRLIYEPYQSGATVTEGSWQNWDAHAGNWWLSKANDLFGGFCSQSSPCTLADLTTQFPNIGVNGGVNDQIVLKAGSGWDTPFVGNVDALTVGFGNNTTTYDFELYGQPTSMNDCKKNGYKSLYDNNNDAFKNQGQCVSWVQHNVNGNGQGNQGQVQGANTDNTNSSNTNGGTQTGSY
jgi:hypothetical protein